MMRRAFVVLVALSLILGPTLGALAETPATIRVLIDDTKTTNSFFTIPSKPKVTKGQRVRLVVENHGAEPHSLQSNETKDVIYTLAGETKILEFTATQAPVLFTCKIGARIERFTIEPGSH